MDTLTLYRLSPALIPLAAAFLILLVEVFIKNTKHISFFVTLASVIAGLVLGISLFADLKGITYSFGHSLYLSQVWIIVSTLLLITTVFIILFSYKDKDLKGEYYFFILMAVSGMMGAAASANLLMIFLFIELLSLCFYVMVTYNSRDVRANEGALKYFILGAFAAGFFVLGIAFIYATTSSLMLPELTFFIEAQHESLPITLYIGISSLIVALGFKAAAVPFHMWTPDAYEAAPIQVTGFMATAVKITSFSVLFSVFMLFLSPIHKIWLPIMYGLALLTMTLGNLAAIVQDSLKRLLAYSAIAHAGYLLITFVVFNHSLPEHEAVIALFFYLIVYSFMNLGAFAVLTVIKQDDIKAFQGLGFKYPYLAFALTVFLLSLAGIPPTAGFLAKFYIFAAAVKTDFYWLALFGVINAFIGIYYYTKIVVAMYMKESSSSLDIKQDKLMTGLIAILIVLVFYLGIHPEETLNLIQKAVLGLFG